MNVIGKDVLIKLRSKNRSNTRLVQAIDQLMTDLNNDSATSAEQFLETRKDADKVHNKGFYFFNLHIHRTLLLIDVMDNEATVVWAGTHEDYKAIFKNNKDTIEKWLRARCWIN